MRSEKLHVPKALICTISCVGLAYNIRRHIQLRIIYVLEALHNVYVVFIIERSRWQRGCYLGWVDGDMIGELESTGYDIDGYWSPCTDRVPNLTDN